MDNSARKSASEVASEISEKGEDTQITKVLSDLVSKGVGFHHAGLGVLTRNIVERSFKAGVIKLLTATQTLAPGWSLPGKTGVFVPVFLDMTQNMEAICLLVSWNTNKFVGVPEDQVMTLLVKR